MLIKREYLDGKYTLLFDSSFLILLFVRNFSGQFLLFELVLSHFCWRAYAVVLRQLKMWKCAWNIFYYFCFWIYHIPVSGYTNQLFAECLWIVRCGTGGDWGCLLGLVVLRVLYLCLYICWADMAFGKTSFISFASLPFSAPPLPPSILQCWSVSPRPTHPIVYCILYSSSVGRGVHVWLSFWGYANCYADIIINSLGKQAGNKLGFEWVIVFLRCAAFLFSYPHILVAIALLLEIPLFASAYFLRTSNRIRVWQNTSDTFLPPLAVLF